MNLQDSKKSNTLLGVYIDNIKNEYALNELFYSISKQEEKVDVVIFYDKLDNKQLDILKKVAANQVVKVNVFNEETKKNESIESKGENVNATFIKDNSEKFSEIFNKLFQLSLDSSYEFFCIIEQEDVLALNWFKTAFSYTKENDDIDVFIPLVRNTTNGVFSGIMNEAPWAEGMVEEAGKVDVNLLTRFNCINPLGALYRTESIEDNCEPDEDSDDEKVLPMKESMVISHYYEFFMRMVYNDIKIMSVPRIGYELRITTRDEFSQTSSKIPQNLVEIPKEKGGLSPDEGRFWMDLAKKEYFFDEDRKKEYEQPQNA